MNATAIGAVIRSEGKENGEERKFSSEQDPLFHVRSCRHLQGRGPRVCNMCTYGYYDLGHEEHPAPYKLGKQLLTRRNEGRVKVPGVLTHNQPSYSTSDVPL